MPLNDDDERCHVHDGEVPCSEPAVARVYDDDDPYIGTPACKAHVSELAGVVEVDARGLGAYWLRHFADLGRQVRRAR